MRIEKVMIVTGSGTPAVQHITARGERVVGYVLPGGVRWHAWPPGFVGEQAHGRFGVDGYVSPKGALDALRRLNK